MDRRLHEPRLIRHLEEKDASCRKVLEEQLPAQKREISPIIESDNTDILIKLVLQKIGITFLPEFFSRNMLEFTSVRSSFPITVLLSAIRSFIIKTNGSREKCRNFLTCRANTAAGHELKKLYDLCII